MHAKRILQTALRNKRYVNDAKERIVLCTSNNCNAIEREIEPTIVTSQNVTSQICSICDDTSPPTSANNGGNPRSFFHALSGFLQGVLSAAAKK